MADFDYALPPERVAQTPVEPRHDARLLVDCGPDRAPDHRRVRELASLLRPGDLVVVNDSRVIPARLRLHRASGGGAEVLLLEPMADGLDEWEALVRPGRKLRTGEPLLAADGTPVVAVWPAGGDAVRPVRVIGGDVLALLERYGEVPLPPYTTAPLADPERYQTVYA